MYSKISVDNINKIKDILYNAEFKGKKINLEIERLNITICINAITIPQNISDLICESSFMYNDSFDVVIHKSNKYELALEMWERATIENGYSINVSLNCFCDDFGIGFGRAFYQIELSEALEDNKYIYLLRNITQFLNNSSILEVKEYGCEILYHKNESFLVIGKFQKSNMNDVSTHSQVFIDFLKNFIRCAFLNEGFKIELYNE